MPADTGFPSSSATPDNNSKWENGIKCFLKIWSNPSKYVPDVKPLAGMQIEHGWILPWPPLNLFHLVLATHLRFFFLNGSVSLSTIWIQSGWSYSSFTFFLTLMKINWSLDVLLMLIYFLQLQKAHISIGSLNWNIQPKSSLSRQGHFFLSRSYPEEGTAQRAVASGKSLWTTPVNDRLLSSLSESPPESFPH